MNNVFCQAYIPLLLRLKMFSPSHQFCYDSIQVIFSLSLSVCVCNNFYYLYLSHTQYMFVHVYMIGPCNIVFLSFDLVIYPAISDTGFEIIT